MRFVVICKEGDLKNLGDRRHLVAKSGLRAPESEPLHGNTPVSTVRLCFISDAPGIWLYHCHISDHMLAGMDARYEVKDR